MNLAQIAEPRLRKFRPTTQFSAKITRERRQLDEAEAEYSMALRLDPNFVLAMVNLADLDRAAAGTTRGGAAAPGP